MTPTSTHLLQDAFRHTVVLLDRLHIHTVNADPGDVRVLHRLWEVVDNYQTSLTLLIQDAASSPNDEEKD